MHVVVEAMVLINIVKNMGRKCPKFIKTLWTKRKLKVETT